ncbi:MAG: hypothetical protein JKX81_09035 [Arenicella sp.]|nr:hypothetical protein [Arenicella sp.]
MKTTKYKFSVTGVLLICLVANMNVIAGETAIEWAPFIKASGVTDEQLIVKANDVNSDFLLKQKGFIKRELIKKNDNEYADVVYLETKSDAIKAGEKVNTCVKCGEYFELMKMGEAAGEGFSHYSIIKSWKR